MTDTTDIVLTEVSKDADGLQALESSTAAGTSAVSNNRLSAQQRKHRRFWLVVFAGVYLIALIVPRSNLPHIPLCWLNATTGFPCPTCGLTRAFTEIGHGQFAAATELNLLAIPVFMIGLAVAGLLIFELRTGKNLLCPWVARHCWTLIFILAACVLLRYLPMMVGS